MENACPQKVDDLKGVFIPISLLNDPRGGGWGEAGCAVELDVSLA